MSGEVVNEWIEHHPVQVRRGEDGELLDVAERELAVLHRVVRLVEQPASRRHLEDRARSDQYEAAHAGLAEAGRERFVAAA